MENDENLIKLKKTLQLKTKQLEELNEYLGKLSIEEYYVYEYDLFLNKTNNDTLQFISSYPTELKTLQEEVENLKNKINIKKEVCIMRIEQEIKELAKIYADNLKSKIVTTHLPIKSGTDIAKTSV